VGGGPGGLYAAWACAKRGHHVTLVEREQELGGNFRIASYPTGKGQLSEAIRSMIVRAEKAGVTFRLGTEATEDLLRELAPDAIVLATGSEPLVLRIPGLQECGYITAQDMLLGKAAMGKRVLVVGGGMVGCEAAEYLAERGHEVGIIEMKDVIAADVVPENRRYMFENFRRHEVLLRPGAKVGQFYTDGVDYTLADGTTGSLRGYDNIVLAMGSRSNTALKEAAEAIAAQVLVIGEAAKAPGNAVLATGDALNAAMAI
jgi:NADPH-dependent 2,4-dienoyl-CoA reductase/sulfur reductase-like enzyme